jgi:hypothetical protein
LLVLNLTLLLCIGTEAWQLRKDWVAARTREQALLRRGAKPEPSPPVIYTKPVEPVLAASYADIALKMLFSRDRNPTVVVEAPAPPPPKPMPPLPLLYGVMNLVDGATAIMSVKAGARHLGVRAGDQVGEFTLLTVSHDQITLEWEGKEITKSIDEMIDRSGQPPATADSMAQRTAAPAPSAAASPTPPKPKGEAAPGADTGSRIRACQPGDTSPAGTQSGGFRKVVSNTPFGEQCRWEPL